jgi:hypothetical protein
MYEARTKASSFVKWTAASAQAAENAEMADKAHAFFMLRSVFKKWDARCTQAVVDRKVEDMADRRRKRELKEAMNGERFRVDHADCSLA